MQQSLSPLPIFPLLFLLILFVSCGKSQTEEKLLNKTWKVVDVRPPSGTFNIEKSQQAKELKNGFYREAWFKFLEDSLFIASFNGKADTGKYAIQKGGKDISLFPRKGGQPYERIELLDLKDSTMEFRTGIADFDMQLSLKAEKDQ